MGVATALPPSGAQLPIAQYRDAIVDAVRRCPVTVLVGETGSGKTTQLPRFLYEAGLAGEAGGAGGGAGGGGGASRARMIVVTQPRRVAAITVARRVAAEMRTPLGAGAGAGLVGYSVRFDDTTGPRTRIKFATDGMLLREAQLDPLLSRYSVVILDEAHE